jgi:arylformamidase
MTRVAFEHLSREELDFQLSPSRSAKDAGGVLARHEAETAALESDPAVTVQCDLAYGPKPRQRIDLCRPRALTGPVSCLVFIHGGFWQEGSKAGAGFAARAFAEAGWAHAALGYTLTPEARLRDIVAEIGAALCHLRRIAPKHGIDPSRIVLAGHSAGGHLATAVLAGLAGDAAAEALAGAVAISGVFDLAPVAASYVNDLARIDAAEIADLSPLLHRPVRDVPLHLLIGADEPAAFHAQTDALEAAWAPYLSRLTVHRAPGCDHFDILEQMAAPGAPTVAEIRRMAAE